MMARWKMHVAAAKSGSTTAFHRAIRKHGDDAWIHVLLETFDTELEAKAAEVDWIAATRANGTQGYNETSGGDGTCGYAHSKATREKIGDAKRGRAVSAESRAKMRAAAIGRKLSRETRRKISMGSTQVMTDPSVRAKISVALTGRALTAEHRANISSGKKKQAAHSMLQSCDEVI